MRAEGSPNVSFADCTYIVDLIPAPEFGPHFQATQQELSLRIPPNAYRWQVPAMLKHGDCKITISLADGNTRTDLIPPAFVMQVKIWWEVKNMLKDILSKCKNNALGGYYAKKWDVPGYQLVRINVALIKDAHNIYII
jgi:hypothetical protein